MSYLDLLVRISSFNSGVNITPENERVKALSERFVNPQLLKQLAVYKIKECLK